MNTMKKNEENKVSICTLDRLSNQERYEILASELFSLKPQKDIIKEYSVKWNCKPVTIRALLIETLAYINKTFQEEKEQMRTLNQMRLDTLFGEAKSVKEKLNILDQINKLFNLYEQNVNVGNKDSEEIKFDIGTK